MKYLDWKWIERFIKRNPDAVIYAGIKEDWSYTKGLIYHKGKYCNGQTCDHSDWGTPIINVWGGCVIDCWTYEPEQIEEGNHVPVWWGNGTTLYNEQDF